MGALQTDSVDADSAWVAGRKTGAVGLKRRSVGTRSAGVSSECARETLH